MTTKITLFRQIIRILDRITDSASLTVSAI